MKNLDLPLKRKWYEMIESGKKTEEYRDIKPYWSKRLADCGHDLRYCRTAKMCGRCSRLVYSGWDKIQPAYTHVNFRYGYTKRTMLREIESISIGYGKPEWGAPTDRQVFIIKFKEGGEQ